jgi:subtilisin family serine protease
MASVRKGKSEESLGNYLWRGGKTIRLEKAPDRFTVMRAGAEQIAQLERVRGVKSIAPVTSRIFRVLTAPADRDTLMETLRAEPFRAIAHHAYRMKGAEGTLFYITDRILVAFDGAVSAKQIDRLVSRYALVLLKEYDRAGHQLLLQVTGSAGENPVKVANRLAREKGVRYAEVNLVNRFRSAFVPEDSLFPHQWHLSAKDAPQLLASASIDAPAAWDTTRGERSIVLAVVDDGFDLDHPDFTGVKKVVHPKDYVDGDANPFPARKSGSFHGTACAGLAIAEINGRGVVGVAPGCAFMPVRFPLVADDDLLVDIFGEVGRFADVASFSWGPPPVYAPLSSAVAEAVTRLVESGGPRGKGCVCCVAAGNYDAPVRDTVNAKGFVWRDPVDGVNRRTTGPILNGLAAHPRVMAIAASTSLSRHAEYSNWGEEISVCAPGGNFHPLDPQAFAPGREIWSTEGEAYGDGSIARSRYLAGGSSGAAPLAAGVAALVLSANSALSAQEVRRILEETSDKIVDTVPDLLLGAKRGRYDAHGHSAWFGFGKVNAAKAVAEASRRRRE